jgi:glutathione S-transferase
MGIGGGMSLVLFGHPFSSYTQKALIALYADGTAFEFRVLDVETPEPFFTELKSYWPFGKFPVLIDDGEPVIETSCIIEHLQAHHPGPNDWVPDGDLGRRVRFLDRFFDLYVMENMQKIATDPLRPEESRDVFGVEAARRNLDTAYDWIEPQIGQTWAAGDSFTLADCAAAPSLFYADWVNPISAARPNLAAYRERLLKHPAVSRCVEEARPYRHFFPLGAPDQD